MFSQGWVDRTNTWVRWRFVWFHEKIWKIPVEQKKVVWPIDLLSRGFAFPNLGNKMHLKKDSRKTDFCFTQGSLCQEECCGSGSAAFYPSDPGWMFSGSRILDPAPF
jgi:hypothetical protein